jgi:tetratricopeptide (TPR) repeat protein
MNSPLFDCLRPERTPTAGGLGLMMIWLSLTSPLLAEMGKPDLSQEEFIRRVTGSYGILPDREPPLTEGEIVILEQLAPMIQATPQLVVTALITMQLDGRPMSATFEQVLGNLYATEGAWDKAEEAYRRAIAKFPEFQRAWNSLGSMKMEQEDYKEAAKALARSVELGAADAQTYGSLGYSLMQLGQLSAAEVAYDMALLRDPANISWLEGKTRILSEAGRHEETIAAVNELLKLNPTDKEYWYLHANAYLALDDLTTTARSLEIAREVGGIDASSLYLLGNIYLKQDMSRLAFTAYLEAMELSPATAPAVVLGAGRTLVARKRFDLAARLLDAVSDQMDAWPSAEQVKRRLLMGQLAENDQDLVQARHEYEKALEYSPLHSEVLFRLARALAESKEVARAEYYLDKIKDDVTYEYAAQLFLSRLRIEDGRYTESLDSLRKAMRLRPSSEAENLYNRIRVALDNHGSG